MNKDITDILLDFVNTDWIESYSLHLSEDEQDNLFIFILEEKDKREKE